MKKFLLEVIIKGGVILSVCVLLTTLLYSIKSDFYDLYELPEIVSRKQNFKAQSQNINTVFIGSSRIFRHIDPILFDSLTGLRSYNLGYAGLFPFRSYDYLENLNLSANPVIKNVFIELSPIALLGQNFNTDPFIYSISPDRYLTVLNFGIQGPYIKSTRFKYLSGYTLLMAYKYLGVGCSKYLNHLLYGKFDLRVNDDADNVYTKGYLSLDDDLALKGGDYENLVARRNEFLESPSKTLANYTLAYNHYKTLNFSANNDDFTDYVKVQAHNLSKQGIKVYFIINPRQVYSDLVYLKHQKRQLDAYKVFDFTDPEKYADLFLEKYSYDRVHLNEDGAELFTKILSREIVKDSIHVSY
uniref:Uncharacterized protein n=1 Tax=Roseihalotalea indica TaxID=2867963 RepID=A0AA49GQQ8_9BACT|nr:hypothetical protein K4G66_24395 [Tunicatimonas sp. TK19036]